MRSWTYLEIRTKVQNELDIKVLSSESIITAEEMMDYCNQAIDEAESNIHTIYEDYFLAFDKPAIVTGTANLAMPTDIYANKLRAVLYDDGITKYELKRIKRLKKTLWVESNDNTYRYIITNNAATGYEMTLFPTPASDAPTALTRWYIRNAARITADADVCDIPEFVSFVVAKMKALCKQKENGGIPIDSLEAVVERERANMIQTLTEMVDDEDDEVELDVSFYEDFDIDGGTI